MYISKVFLKRHDSSLYLKNSTMNIFNEYEYNTKYSALRFRKCYAYMFFLFSRVVVTGNPSPLKPSIGDSKRSPDSSKAFIESIDKDGDGTLHRKELSNFILQFIGGKAFDEKAEVESEISAMMEKIDQNHDQGLDVKDFNSFWKDREGLLSVDDVADWIVHAGQLPEDIGNIFRNHRVTGYDFPELVEKEGEALGSLLGIENPRWRRIIVRMVNARLLGIGGTPIAPSGATYLVQSCDTVRIEWSHCEARGFPVHEYRVQRRSLGGNHDTHSKNEVTNKTGNKNKDEKNNSDQCKLNLCRTNGDGLAPCNLDLACVETTSDDNVTVPLSKYENSPIVSTDSNHIISSEWKTVFNHSDPKFIDTGLKPGQKYFYRIQAWSLVGRSTWTYIDIDEKKRKKKCTSFRREENNYVDKWTIWNMIQFTFGWLSIIMGITSFLCKFKRETILPLMSENVKSFLKRFTFLSKFLKSYSDEPNLTVETLRGFKKEEEKDKTSQNIDGVKADIVFEVDKYPKRCNTCNKKYKFLKRCKHYCSKCGITFCHKHGKITHSNITHCKFPGTCVCNICLDKIKKSLTK